MFNLSWYCLVFATCSTFVFQPVSAREIFQESTRDLSGSAKTTKFLTPGEIDHWVFEAIKDTTVIVHLTTANFDAVIGLAKSNDESSGESDEILFSIDEEGNNGHFSFRITEAGTYKIRVHGYQMKGGGNYQLDVMQFVGKPIGFGEQVSGHYDDQGKASFFFDGKSAQNLVVNTSSSADVFNSNGEPVFFDWQTNLLIQKDGEHLISMSGAPGTTFSLMIRPAELKRLKLGDAVTVGADGRSMTIWEIDAKPGQFQVITVSKSSACLTRLIFRPTRKPNEKQLNSGESGAGMNFLPVSSKGEFTRYAVVFERSGTYQLQTFFFRETSVEVAMKDPTIALDKQEEVSGKIPIGGNALYWFHAQPGDMVKMSVESDAFDCILRLFDGLGRPVAENDDFGDSRNSQVSQLIRRSGYYRWQIASLGNGGGGDFKINFEEIAKKQISVGTKTAGTTKNQSTEYWTLASESVKTVYINVKSSSFRPWVRVFDSKGRLILQDENGGLGSNSLIPVQLRGDDPVTIWVTTRNGGGTYDIRVIDADWGL